MCGFESRPRHQPDSNVRWTFESGWVKCKRSKASPYLPVTDAIMRRNSYVHCNVQGRAKRADRGVSASERRIVQIVRWTFESGWVKFERSKAFPYLPVTDAKMRRNRHAHCNVQGCAKRTDRDVSASERPASTNPNELIAHPSPPGAD